MNERIWELAEQATETIDVSAKLGIPGTERVFNKEKFAELIVKECLAQCNQHFAGAVGTHAGAYNTGIKKCVDSIKEHFGVDNG